MKIALKQQLFWHVQIKSRNGQVLLTSETYFSKSNAERAAKKLATGLGIKMEDK